MRRFEDKVAVVTGAASGIGRASAMRLAAEGAGVACLDIAEAGLAETVASIRDDGGRAQAWTTDITSEARVGEVVEQACSTLGPPSVLANVAGIGKFAHTMELSFEEWNRIISINLSGTFLMCRACLPHLVRTKGAIVNIASTAGIMGQPYSAAYCASKGGVALLTKSLAVEFVLEGVRVNAIAPGGIETPIIGDFVFPEGSRKRLFNKMLPLQRMGRPEEVAGLVAYLASDEARYMTGAIVPIDGGMTC